MPRAEARRQLEARVASGAALRDRSIESPDQLKVAKHDYYTWDERSLIGKASDQALLPDPDAQHTVGDTAVISGGDSGDQADLTVEEAVVLGPGSEAGQAQYAFLVLITGRDPIGFHFNSLSFQLIDDQDFQYDALSGGGAEPALDFGDLGPDQRVRGWLTFEASAETEHLRLDYFPPAAIESVTFSFIVPR